MHALLEYLGEAGTVGLKSTFVLNNLFAREILKLRDVESFLGAKMAVELPYDPFLYLKAVNEGVPIVTGAPRSAPAERLIKLSSAAFGEQALVPVGVEEKRSGGLFRRRRKLNIGPRPGPHTRRYPPAGALPASERVGHRWHDPDHIHDRTHLSSNHDVEVVSVQRALVEPGMAVPDGLRIRALFDGTNRRPSLRNLAALLLYRTPSRLWHVQDASYKRVAMNRRRAPAMAGYRCPRGPSLSPHDRH